MDLLHKSIREGFSSMGSAPGSGIIPAENKKAMSLVYNQRNMLKAMKEMEEKMGAVQRILMQGKDSSSDVEEEDEEDEGHEGRYSNKTSAKSSE